MDSLFKLTFIENLLDKDCFQKLKDIFLNDFSWYYSSHCADIDDTCTNKEELLSLFTDTPFFFHIFYTNRENFICNKDDFDIIEPFLKKIYERFNNRPIRINRITSNLLPYYKERIGKFNYPHVDFKFTDEEHKDWEFYTCIFYNWM
jgi:hypothetical protein